MLKSAPKVLNTKCTVQINFGSEDMVDIDERGGTKRFYEGSNEGQSPSKKRSFVENESLQMMLMMKKQSPMMTTPVEKKKSQASGRAGSLGSHPTRLLVPIA